MNKPPTSVMVLSIIGIIIGVLGFFGLIWTVIVLLVPIGPPNPALDSLRHDPIYLTISGISLLIGLPLILLLTIASIMSLKLQHWARKGMLFYGWAAIVQGIIGIIFNVAYVFPKMFASMPGAGGPSAKAGMIGGIVGGACGFILGMIFPICIIYFFNRPHVKDAFNGIFPAPHTNFPVQFPQEPNPPHPPTTPQQFP